MGKAVNLYVRDSEVELWDRFVEYAAARRLSLSAAVMMAVEQFLEDQAEE